MKTSGLFTVHGFKIPIAYNKEFRLVFFGDVHRDSPNHAGKAWQEFLRYARSLKNAWFFGMGDYLDSTSTSERACLGNISETLHETLRNDIIQLQTKKCELIAKELEFMRGRIIGMLNGNHYFDFPSGINSDQQICHLLGAKYLGVCAFVRLYFDKHSRRHSRDIFAHHGAGASRLMGGSINRVAQMAEGAEADIYAMGHDHKRIASPGQPRLFLRHCPQNGLSVESREPVVLRSGSFLASFENGVVNYNVDACRPPSALGHVELLVKVKESGEVEMRTLV